MCIRDRGIPYVFIQGLYSWATEKPYVITDDEKGGYFAVKHLIDLGHKKIIGIFKADDSQGYQRHKGFVKGLNEAGIAYNPDLIVWYHTCLLYTSTVKYGAKTENRFHKTYKRNNRLLTSKRT